MMVMNMSIRMMRFMTMLNILMINDEDVGEDYDNDYDDNGDGEVEGHDNGVEDSVMKRLLN